MNAAPVFFPVYGDGVSGRTVARWPGGRSVQVETGRARLYPARTGEAPGTRPFYVEACEMFVGARRVLDAGCGAGTGASLLSGRFEVLAVDKDERAVDFVRAFAPHVLAARADLEAQLPVGSVDAACVVDVLGHVRDPLAALRTVRACLPAGAPMVVAEPRAYPTQVLRAPARRAFSPKALANLLAVTGFDLEEPIGEQSTFVALRARASADPGATALTEAARAFAAGDTAAGVAALMRAEESERRPVRVEALVTLGELRMAQGDGDGAARALLAARVVAPEDPKATVALARLSLAMGERADAEQVARVARTLDPTDVGAVCALALALDPTSDEVEPLLRTAVALSPDDVGLAMAYAGRVGAHASALHALERVKRYAETLPTEFHVLLAELLHGAGRSADARLEARIAAATAPDTKEVRALQQLLAD